MNPVTTSQCAYPGCDQPAATPTSDRGAKPKYCDDASHNPLTAHRERRRLEAENTGQRAEETGGQPVTLGLTRAAELIRTLEKLTAQHADALSRAITELRSAGDVESAEVEVYATRTSADQRIAAAEARFAEEIQRRRDAEADRDQAHADREQADDAASQAITRMDELTQELTTMRTTTAGEIRQLRTDTAAELDQARASALRDIEQAREDAARQVAEAARQLHQAGQETTRAQQAEAAAVQRADRAQSEAAAEIARVRADAQRERDELHEATHTRLAALEETRAALRIRAERAEADLDTARTELSQLAEQLTKATPGTGPDSGPAATTPPRTRAASRTKKAPSTRATGSET